MSGINLIIGNMLGSIVRPGSNVNLFSYKSDMDFWANGIDNVNTSNEVGTFAVAKDFSCLDLTDLSYLQCTAGFNMTDATATYEYYYELILDNIIQGTKTLMESADAIGFRMQIRDNGLWYIYVRDFESTQSGLSGLNEPLFVVGLNKVNLTFNCLTKSVSVEINGNVKNFVHESKNLIGVDGKYFRIGSAGGTLEKPIYFKWSKNGQPVNEFYFTKETFQIKQGTVPNHQDFWDIIGNEKEFGVRGSINGVDFSKEFDKQSLTNPFRNGYDLYWNQGTLDYLKVVPINANGTSINYDNLEFFSRVLPGKIGYHIFDYLELPDLAIFYTTNRTYWKVAIESDPYYVGGTVGKERYFHKSWLNYEWINTHIEDAYNGLFYVILNKKNAVNQNPVTVSINDIVLFNKKIDFVDKNRDKLQSGDYGKLYISKITDFKTYDATATQRYEMLAIRYDKRIMQRGNRICFSSDRGKTWNNGIDPADISTLSPMPTSRVEILESGRILLFSHWTVAYYSDDNLETIIPISLLDIDGQPYVFHTPANPAYPGAYWADFHNFIEENGLLIYGNYTNSNGGASPVMYYYSINDGATWKVFYKYGQNPLYTDDGTSMGGIGGTLLGDPNNTKLARHTHGINKGFDNSYYACTGDSPGEMHFMKLDYNSVADTWSVVDLLEGTEAINWQRMRGIGMYVSDGYTYWGSDGLLTDTVNEVEYNQHGIFRCAIADLGDITKHELLQELNDEAFAFLRLQGDIIVCGMDVGNDFIYFSEDKGNTWTEFAIPFNDRAIRPANFDKTNNYLLVDQNWIFQYLSE